MLVVDDDELSVRLVRHVLEQHGFEVEAVTDGVAALDALEHRPPDVVVLDVMMPGMDGGEVLERVKSSPRLQDVPVIMLTSRADDEDVIASYRSGADYHITKPLVPSQLLYGLGLVLGREIPGTVAISRTAPQRPDRAR